LQSLMRDIVAVDETEGGPHLDSLKVSRAHKKMKALERERQVKCAVKLVERLEPVVNAPPDQKEQALMKWQAGIEEEIDKLKKAPCGVEMLYLIGWLYVNGAQQFDSANIAKRALAVGEAKVHLAKTKGTLVTSAGRTCLTVNGIMKSVEKKKKLKQDEEKGKEKGKDKIKSPPSEQGKGKEEGAAKSSSEDQATSASSSAESQQQAGGSSSSTSHQPKNDTKTQSKPEEKQLRPGTVVLLCNLRSNPELNEEVGVIQEFDVESGRYVIHLLSEDLGFRKLKRDNFIIIEDSDRDDGDQNGASAEPDAGAGDYSIPGGPGSEEAEMAEAFKETMPLFHDTLWSVTSLDIEFTLAKVVRRVLKDMSVDKHVRQGRVEALRRLGHLLQEPMRERKRDMALGKTQEALQDEMPSSPSSALTHGSAKSTSTRTSVLARLKPRWTMSKTDKAEAAEAKAQVQQGKQKQMEAALALMAAGASTDDVDEMLAARSAMEREHGTSQA